MRLNQLEIFQAHKMFACIEYQDLRRRYLSLCMHALCVVRRAAPARSALLIHQPRDPSSLSPFSRACRPTTHVRLSLLLSSVTARSCEGSEETPVRLVNAHIV